VQKARQKGFTLIELSIVLVIIGLIVGGVLVGQDLIRAAEVRATISQIEKYNTAVNTFRVKYDALPGDMTQAAATPFGFYVGKFCQGQYDGARDGNGIIAGGPGQPVPYAENDGETLIFWEDLSRAQLIDSTLYNDVLFHIECSGWSELSSTPTDSFYIGNVLPAAKLGNGNFIYVYNANGSNWFGVSVVSGTSGSALVSAPGMTVQQARSIDEKVDDGLPTAGNVTAIYLNNSVSATVNAPNATISSSTTCYDTTSNHYSVSQNGGAGVNCALSFRFQ
jgi:prepilin-type N-terminal cleavage/methylation domain-containing protein